jgi:hypothetical protein
MKKFLYQFSQETFDKRSDKNIIYFKIFSDSRISDTKIINAIFIMKTAFSTFYMEG